MSKVVKTTDFKNFMGKYANELISDKLEHPDYFIVANANRADRSFIVVKKEYFMALLKYSSLEEELERVKTSLNDITKYVTKKYQAMRAKA